MKRGLMRPAAALFPLVLMAASLLGAEMICTELFLIWLVMQLCSLCSAGAFRNAAAREPGMRRVDRLFSGAMLLSLLSIAAVAAIEFFFAWEGHSLLEWIGLFAAAAGIMIEQVFEERMYALSRPVDGAMLSLISDGLLFVGLMMDRSGTYVLPAANFFTGCAGALMALISVISAYIVQPIRGFSLIPRSIPAFPKACAQGLMYFVMVAGLGLLMLKAGRKDFIAGFEHDFSAIFFGMIPWQLARTVCRRAPDESRPLNLMLVCFANLPLISSVAIAYFLPEFALAEPMLRFGFMGLAALLAGLVMYCAPGVRIYVGAALTAIAAFFCMDLQASWTPIAVCVLGMATIILNLKQAFLRKV